MTRSLKGKMILSYLAVALLTVLVASVLIRLNSGRSLMSLVVEEQTASLSQKLQEFYTANGTLKGFFDSAIQADRQNPPPQQPGGVPGKSSEPREVRGVIGLVDADYTALMPTLGYAVGQTVPQSRLKQTVPVTVSGKTIAWILPDTSFQFKLSTEEQLFLQRSSIAITAAALTGVLAALAIGFFLAGRLLKPIRSLTQASQALARGELRQQVPVVSKDELGLLTATFNQMSADLDRADQHRKRITADITHDLSTPLQIISGYIEMLEAGEVTLTPQRIEIIKTEVGHLRRLVGDLSTLTQVEGGGLEIQPEAVPATQLLQRVCQAFEPIAAHQGVALSLQIPSFDPMLRVDQGRMMQVLKNLMENALRYTPKGGSIQLGAEGGDPVRLWVQDSGEGIDAEDLPYVFERFYRADKARGAGSGKMGLGLAICKALVEAQDGVISAQSGGKGQGTKMILDLPAAPPPSP